MLTPEETKTRVWIKEGSKTRVLMNDAMDDCDGKNNQIVDFDEEITEEKQPNDHLQQVSLLEDETEGDIIEIECAAFADSQDGEKAPGPKPSLKAWETSSVEKGFFQDRSCKIRSLADELADRLSKKSYSCNEYVQPKQEVVVNITADSSAMEMNNGDFTICNKCLSNRRKEFRSIDEISPDFETDKSLDSSKEICICSRKIDCSENLNGLIDIEARQPKSEISFTGTFSSLNQSRFYHVNDLPDEIMLKIFSYFTPTQLCRYVAPVCVTWLAYARDSTLWEEITEQEFKDVSSDLLVKVITSWCSLLRVLDLKGRTDMKKCDFEAIFKSCPQIERLSFAFCYQIDDEILKLLSSYCHHLMYVNFEGCQISDSSLMYLFGKPIHGLNLSHCSMISDEGLMFIANNFKYLTSINVDGIQWISQSSIENLVNLQADTLVEITLDGDDLVDDCVRILSRCQHIRVFSLSFCDALTDDSLGWIKQFKHLKHLQLKKGLNFSNNGMLNLLRDLRNLEKPGLTYLSLSECSSLSDGCLRAISESCLNLVTLNLSWCWEVTDDGINFILDSCHKMKELHLCGLHELYGVPLRRVPLEMPQLAFLDLRQCNKTSDDLLADLANEMNSLTVLNYYGDVVKPSLNFWNLESKCSPGHFHHTSY